jgi:wyosine [tRNA(Phe)-imidazoG37] synthetase (radical SAM superfamily)
MLLPLQKGVLYGPINSRRLGRSLGINLMPVTYKLCSFNCVYCHYGPTDVLTRDVATHVQNMPGLHEVVAEVEHAFSSSIEFDYITFSGNGEPTLHPEFSAIARAVATLRDRMRPEVKIALLSNSTGYVNPALTKVLAFIDNPYFKLDAGNEVLYQKINRPAADIEYEHIVDFLRELPGIIIQTVIMAGAPANDGDEAIDAYIEKINTICPREVQIYSLDRPVSDSHIARVKPEELKRISRLCKSRTGIRVTPFYVD